MDYGTDKNSNVKEAKNDVLCWTIKTDMVTENKIIVFNKPSVCLFNQIFCPRARHQTTWKISKCEMLALKWHINENEILIIMIIFLFIL